jgi:urea transport system permease protein
LNSIELVVWVAVGGRATLYGAVAGALMVNYAKSYFTAALPEIWLFALGALFIVVTVYLPKGVVGLMAQLRQRYQSSHNNKNTTADSGEAA